ncbi:hypothetical protein AB4Y85_00495 [Microvirga sp. 2YAF29]|uniref:hypothetical protein n=1 Tax=Microvirga sp. 2YAF29 TaxID=3233031 RepID=UPI003F9DC53C
MTTELHEGHLEPTRLVEAPAKLSWRDKREVRRRKRVWFEEILAWILVPVILFGCYWLATIGLAAVGTSPEALLDGFKTITNSL